VSNNNMVAAPACEVGAILQPNFGGSCHLTFICNKTSEFSDHKLAIDSQCSYSNLP
jgi:hypothetical protein